MSSLLLLATLGAAPMLPADAPLAVRPSLRGTLLGSVARAQAAGEEGAVEAPAHGGALAPLAQAGEAGPKASARMVAHMEDYLEAERSESKLFVGVGALSVVGGAVALAASDSAALRGASLPVMGVGLIQLVVGGSVWWRTDAQMGALREQIQTAPERYVSEERQRMQVVNDNFVIYRWTEIGLLGAGAALGAGGYALERDFVMGLGLGLAVQSALMLGLDYFAERRGHEYARQVGTFRF